MKPIGYGLLVVLALVLALVLVGPIVSEAAGSLRNSSALIERRQ